MGGLGSCIVHVLSMCVPPSLTPALPCLPVCPRTLPCRCALDATCAGVMIEHLLLQDNAVVLFDVSTTLSQPAAVAVSFARPAPAEALRPQPRRVFPTLVTAFFDTNRSSWSYSQRPFAVYARNINRTLTLPNPMVIFTEPQYELLFRLRRAELGYENITLIIPMPMADLPTMRYARAIERIMALPQYLEGNPRAHYPEYCRPLYNVVVWAKTDFMARAAKMNPFWTSHFAWIDAGLHPEILLDEHMFAPFPSPSRLAALLSLDAVYMPTLDPLTNDTFAEGLVAFTKQHRQFIVAGAWAGTPRALFLFNQSCFAEFESWLARDHVDSEQTAYTAVALREPSLVVTYSINGRFENILTHF